MASSSSSSSSEHVVPLPDRTPTALQAKESLPMAVVGSDAPRSESSKGSSSGKQRGILAMLTGDATEGGEVSNARMPPLSGNGRAQRQRQRIDPAVHRNIHTYPRISSKTCVYITSPD